MLLAEHLVLLRALAENGDWDDYHRFRKQQRHRYLYHTTVPDQHDPEQQALTKPPSGRIIRLDQAVQRRRSQRTLYEQPLWLSGPRSTHFERTHLINPMLRRQGGLQSNEPQSEPAMLLGQICQMRTFVLQSTSQCIRWTNASAKISHWRHCAGPSPERGDLTRR